MDTKKAYPALFLPGAIMPVAPQYEPLLKVLNGTVEPFLKDLELYRDVAPPLNYSLDMEVQALRLLADDWHLQDFHLVGYSGGGAVALAFTVTYPDRVRTLALSEPAVIPSPAWMRAEAAYYAEIKAAMALPPADQIREFTRLNLRPGVTPPPTPPGPPPAWMSLRPAGLRALNAAFYNTHLDLDSFRQYRRPVYLAIGSLTNAVEERKAKFLADLFPDFRLEVYEGRHHFDPPQRAEPERFARALRELWARGESMA